MGERFGGNASVIAIRRIFIRARTVRPGGSGRDITIRLTGRTRSRCSGRWALGTSRTAYQCNRAVISRGTPMLDLLGTYACLGITCRNGTLFRVIQTSGPRC